MRMCYAAEREFPCVRDVCVVYIFMRRMYCYIYTQYFIYLYFLTTYSAPFERFNGHLLTNCKCFGLLSASAASAAAAAVRWFSERNQSDVYNKFTVIYAYKNCTAINFRVCGGRSSGFACSDSSKKTPKSRVKCENYLGGYELQNTHTSKIPWSPLRKIQISYQEIGKLQKELTDLRIPTTSNVAAVFPCTGYKIYIVFNSNAAMFHIDDLTLRE